MQPCACRSGAENSPREMARAMRKDFDFLDAGRMGLFGRRGIDSMTWPQSNKWKTAILISRDALSHARSSQLHIVMGVRSYMRIRNAHSL